LYIYIHTRGIFICIHVYICMHTHVFVYINTCIHIYIHMYTHIHIYMYIYIYVCKYAYTYLYICIYHICGYTCIYIHKYTNIPKHALFRPIRVYAYFFCMRWLRWVGSLKLQVSFAKEPYKRDHILHKRPIILRSLLIVATP